MERYESLGLVGEGSYGTVLKCRHRDSGRLVAIKKFMDSDDDKTVKKIALREIKLLRQLRHDNLVNLLEVWRRRRRWYLVFEFVERTLLDDLEQNPSGLDLNASRRYLYQILRAAAFCHQHGIIHRDIKPENILISQGGVVKLCDFGFARTVTSPAEGGVYTDYVATRWYRAPELLVGDTKYGKPVDVWAVGCLLLEMLTGQPLFPGDSDLDQIYHVVRCFGHLTAPHQELFYRNPVFSGVKLPECSGVPLEERFPTVTPSALHLAQSCLQMDPERRAQCSELLQHPLFTQDAFHVRILDELNAKIQKDHRVNSTFPKITKTPRQEKEEGDEKNRRGKHKKQSEGSRERVNRQQRDEEAGEDRTAKSRGRQPSKPPKAAQNPCEPLTSTKPPKTPGARSVGHAAKTAVKTKLGREAEICKSVAANPKQGKVASPEPSDEHLKAGSTERSTTEVWRSTKSEPSRDFGKSWNDSNTKEPKSSKSSITGQPSGSSSPKVSFRSTTERTDATENPDGASTATVPPHTELSTPATPPTTEPGDGTAASITEQSNNSSEAEPNTKPLKPSNSKSVVGQPRRRGAPPERRNTTLMSTVSGWTPFSAAGHKAFPNSSVAHSKDELDLTGAWCPPPPPPPPPPSSSPLTASVSVVSTFSTFSQAGFHPGSSSLRCTDKPRRRGGVHGRLVQPAVSSHTPGPLPAQVSEKNLVCERCLLSGMKASRKADIHFPELRGRRGKHNRSSSRDQRKDKQPAVSTPTSGQQQH